jgi:hypothetical protein
MLLATNARSWAIREVMCYAMSHPQLKGRRCSTRNFVPLLNYLGESNIVNEKMVMDAFAGVDPGLYSYESDLGIPNKSGLQLEISSGRKRGHSVKWLEFCVSDNSSRRRKRSDIGSDMSFSDSSEESSSDSSGDEYAVQNRCNPLERFTRNTVDGWTILVPGSSVTGLKDYLAERLQAPKKQKKNKKGKKELT